MNSLQRCLALAKSENPNDRDAEVIDFIPSASAEFLLYPLKTQWFCLTEEELIKYLDTHKDESVTISETWEDIVERAYELFQNFDTNICDGTSNDYEGLTEDWQLSSKAM